MMESPLMFYKDQNLAIVSLGSLWDSEANQKLSLLKFCRCSTALRCEKTAGMLFVCCGTTLNSPDDEVVDLMKGNIFEKSPSHALSIYRSGKTCYQSLPGILLWCPRLSVTLHLSTCFFLWIPPGSSFPLMAQSSLSTTCSIFCQGYTFRLQLCDCWAIFVHSLCTQEVNYSLCSLCGLHIYTEHTWDVWSAVCVLLTRPRLRLCRPRLSHWIVMAVSLVYNRRGLPVLQGVKAHSTRGVATSWALLEGCPWVRSVLQPAGLHQFTWIVWIDSLFFFCCV